MASEPKRVGECNFDLSFSGFIRNRIQRTLRVWVDLIDGGGDNALFETNSNSRQLAVVLPLGEVQASQMKAS